MEKRDFNGFKPMSKAISQVIKPYINEKTPLIMKIASDWHMIVGTEMGKQTKPVKITFAGGNKEGGVLTLEVYEGMAAQLQYALPDVMERIAVYFGYKLVDQIKLKQVPLGVPPKPKSNTEKRISADEQEKINNMLAGIEDDELNSALKSFLTTAYKKDNK